MIQECPECGEPVPVVRRPANLRQALWGGATCRNCGVEFDKFGRLVGGREASAAGDPLGLAISDDKLRVLRPDLYGVAGFLRKVREKTGWAWEQREYLDGALLPNGPLERKAAT